MVLSSLIDAWETSDYLSVCFKGGSLEMRAVGEEINIDESLLSSRIFHCVLLQPNIYLSAFSQQMFFLFSGMLIKVKGSDSGVPHASPRMDKH